MCVSKQGRRGVRVLSRLGAKASSRERRSGGETGRGYSVRQSRSAHLGSSLLPNVANDLRLVLPSPSKYCAPPSCVFSDTYVRAWIHPPTWDACRWHECGLCELTTPPTANQLGPSKCPNYTAVHLAVLNGDRHRNWLAGELLSDGHRLCPDATLSVW